MRMRMRMTDFQRVDHFNFFNFNLLSSYLSEMSVPLLKPGGSQKRLSSQLTLCILCEKACYDDRSNYPETSWKKLEECARQWIGLDKFGKVHESVKWEDGPTGCYFHKDCRLFMSSARKLEQAKNRQSKIRTASLATLPTIDEDEDETESKNRSSRSSIGNIHDKSLCIWCMKSEDTKHPGNPLRTVEQWNAWQKIKSHTPYLTDQSMRDRLIALITATSDPFAAEIRYHPKCWRKFIKPIYTNDDEPHLSDMRRQEILQLFLNHTQTAIFDNNEPRSLQGLLRDYIEIHRNFGYDCSATKSSTIKDILCKEFGDKIGIYTNRFHKNQSGIVYDAALGGTFIEAALNGWGIDDEQLLNLAARRLSSLCAGFSGINWPPRIDELETKEELCPALTKFLIWLRKPAEQLGELQDKTKPELEALSSIMLSYINRMRTVTKINMSVTLHGLTRSREIIDIMSKSGIGISYTDVLNLYESWAKSGLDETHGLLRELAEDYPGCAITDNDDFKDDTVTGAGTSHRTNLMFVQKLHLIRPITRIGTERLKLVSSSELKQLSDRRNEINPYRTMRPGLPPIREQINTDEIGLGKQRNRMMIHTILRLDETLDCVEPSDQNIASYRGCQANIRPICSRSKAYYFCTLPQPPNKTVVHEVMTRTLEVAVQKRMPFVLLTGDQPVYTLMVQLKNENEGKFKKIIPFLGPFHQQCSFMACILKRFAGSGLEDILVAAGVIADGSVEKALKGKHYRRGVRLFGQMYESLMRTIVKRAQQNGIYVPSELFTKVKMLRESTEPREDLTASWTQIEKNESFTSFATKVFEDLSENSMTNFWLSFMEMVEILYMNINSIRLANWEEYLQSTRMMLPWLKVYDQDKYGRWLQEFWLSMKTLPKDISSYMPQLFAQSITGKPYSLLPLDLWIEMTMNKGSKLKAGWLKILKNEKMLLMHTLNINNVVRARSALHRNLSISRNIDKHRENTKPVMKAEEQGVQDIMSCMTEFECNPFNCENYSLRSLQSGMLATTKLEEDLESARLCGKELVDDFFKDRMFSNRVAFDARVHKNKRCNFAKPPNEGAKELTEQQKRIANMEKTAIENVLNLMASETRKVDLHEVMNHRVTEECLSIFNQNGTMVKSQKSKLLECMQFEPLCVETGYIAIVDMGMIWRLAAPTTEDRAKDNGEKYIWEDYAQKLIEVVKARHRQAGTIIFVNDPYDLPLCIKDSEHQLRTNKYASGTKNIIIRRNVEFPSKREFDASLRSDSNKIRMQTLLKECMRDYAKRNSNIRFIYSLQKQCFDLSAGDSVMIKDFQCQHYEADTIIFYIYSQIRKMTMQETVVIDATDTDVIVLSAYVSTKESGKLGIRRKSGLVVDCKKLFPKQVVDVIVPLHVHSGADTVTGFFGRSKKAIFNSSLKSPLLLNLKDIGKQIPIKPTIVNKMVKYTLNCVYNQSKSESLAEARAQKWKSMKRKSFRRLPPDIDSYKLKLARVNFQAFIMLNYAKDTFAHSPLDSGWEITSAGQCIPTRHASPALPQRFNKLLMSNTINICETSDDSSSEDSDSLQSETDSDTDSYETDGSFTD